MEQNKRELSAVELQKILPHRYPMLLVDKLILLPREGATQIEPGMKVAGIKNVTFNEPFFTGHFPGKPIMPGVLIVEALAQCTCAGGLLLEENRGKLGLFTGIDQMKFRRQVIPGDVLLLEAEFTAYRRNMGKVAVKASVDGVVAAEGIIRFAMVENDG
ncbi:MAG: 3-hydroxyacyl-ACP dehydratase FabZ [Acetivibrionales bacterium]|jgi:3-hydroxyacyl-[acyl-carrier-protein] dehydratase|nr:3-hydroxyacyl-ACP dehydratase FabZ [Clostridiaceae bacterium]